MVLCNNVIEVLDNCTTTPKWPPDASGAQVTAIPCDATVERGMRYNPETNDFYFEENIIENEGIIVPPTQLDNIQETQLTIMTAMAEQYEESLERELTNMEVQATIYEAILEMGGAE